MLMWDPIRLLAQTNQHQSLCCSLDDDTCDKERLKPDFH
jgi:hypothetical protein